MYGLGIPRLLAQLGSRLDYWRRVNGSSHFLKVFGFSRDRLSFKEKKKRIEEILIFSSKFAEIPENFRQNW